MDNSDDKKRELCKKMWMECKGDLTRFCQYKLSSYPEEIDDVISDAFYYLCSAVLKNEHLDNPKAWLMAVTNNLIKKKYAELNIKKNRYVSFTEENLEGRDYIDNMIFDDIVSDKMIEEISEKILANLGVEEQELYKYIYLDKLKMKEIALLMDLSDVNVRQRHFRLSRKLKSMVKEYIEDCG